MMESTAVIRALPVPQDHQNKRLKYTKLQVLRYQVHAVYNTRVLLHNYKLHRLDLVIMTA